MKITTRKLQPTDTKGERVRASSNGRQLTIAWLYSLSTEEMHEKAAVMLAGAGVTRSKSTNTGYVWQTEDGA